MKKRTRALKLTTLSKTLLILGVIFLFMDMAIKSVEQTNRENIVELAKVLPTDTTIVSVKDSLHSPPTNLEKSEVVKVMEVVNSTDFKTRMSYDEPEYKPPRKIEPNKSLILRVQTATSFKAARIAVKAALIKAYPPHGHYPFKDHNEILNKLLPDLIVADIKGRIPFENIAATVLCEGAYKTKIGRKANNLGNVKYRGDGEEGVDFLYHKDV